MYHYTWLKKTDARNVTAADLQDRETSQLIAVKYTKLDKGQRKWNTYEAELFGLVTIVNKFGPLITAATAEYPPSANVSKIGIWGDSTTAIGQWKTMHLPVGTVDHLSAKARRFYSWADKTAGTIHWSLDLRHFPGDSISLPHMMTHMGDMAKARHTELHAASQPYIMAAHTLHSFHPGKVPLKANEPPSDHRVVFLQFTCDEVQKIAEATLLDDTLYLRVPLHDIYKIVANIQADTVPHMHRDKITSWIGTRFFAFTPPQCSHPLLYAPTSFQLIQLDDTDATLEDPTKTLVLVTPKGAMVRITSADRQPVQVSAEDHPTHAELMQHDLRKDMCYLAHNNSDHPSLSVTIKSIREMTWYPGMISYIRYHLDACPICIPKLKALRSIGGSILAAERLSVVYMDHYILKGELPDLTGVQAILSLTCASIRITMFIVVNSTSAYDAIRAIHDRWAPIFGYPNTFKSDNGSAFISECVRVYRSMMGVKHWDFSAADDPTHHALLEHKHKTLNSVLETARLKGDIRSRTDLEFYTSNAMMRHNIILKSEGFTPFEKLSGQPPSTLTDLVTLQSIQPKAPLTPIDADLIAAIRSTTTENIAVANEIRAEKVRRNVLTQDAAQQASNKRPIDLRIGDGVSHNGNSYKLQQLITHGLTGPSKAIIRSKDGSTHRVNYHDLLAQVDPTSELMLLQPESAVLKVGGFVFYDHTDFTIHHGVVTDITLQNDLIIHDYEQADKVKRKFSPLYTDDTGKNFKSDKIKTATVPSGWTPIISKIRPQYVIVAGTISTSLYIEDNILDYMASTGVMMPLFSAPDTRTQRSHRNWIPHIAARQHRSFSAERESWILTITDTLKDNASIIVLGLTMIIIIRLLQ